MYLKAIEIQGFKSFPDKTVLTFGRDITAIVGPNGSGKSNISDAIRWVMGEMSSRALRGSKMEDVIFGGTQKRAQVGFAEVSLVLDNTEHTFDTEGTEVMVTRRFYRSGESEYYINRQSARLRDINELFMDTGLGREGYSNIGQGRIDEILSARSTDRREIFEEAAGISRYRHRKEDTERTLQKTQDNLLRINDKISELELQVNPLREQAEKARQYLLLRDELRGLEITVWLRQLDRLTEEEKKIQADCASAKFLLEQGRADLDAIYARAEDLAASVRKADVETEHLRQELSELEALSAEKSSRSAVLETRRQGNAANIARIRQEMEFQEGRRGDLQAQIAAREQRIAEISEETAAQETFHRQQTERLDLLRQDLTRETDALTELRQEEAELVRQSVLLRSGLSASDSDAEKLKDRQTAAEEKLQEAEQSRQTAQLEQLACAENLRTWKARKEQLQNTLPGYEMLAISLRDRREQLEAQASQMKIQLDTLGSRIRMYREMEQNYEGYSKAARIVMQESDRGNLRHIHGPVSRLLKTEDQYTVAIETALGASAQSIVVDTEQDGKAAISLLRRRDAGRATFLPMSVIRGRRLSEQGLETESGFVGLASDLVTFQPEYREIMENLLGRTAVAEDMDSAIAIAGRHGHRFRIVTLDGQVLNVGGSMTGGSTAKSSGVLTRANELARMEQEEKDLTEKSQDLTARLQDAARLAAEAEAETADGRNQLREAEDQVLRLGQRAEHYTVLMETLSGAVESAQRECDTVRGLLSGGQQQRRALEQEIQTCEQRTAVLNQKLRAAQTESDEASERVETAEQEIHQTELRKSALEAEYTTARSGLAELKKLAEGLGGDREQRQAQIAQYEADNVSLAEEIADCGREIADVRAQTETQRQKIETAVRSRTDVEAEKTAAEREAQQKNRDLLDMERENARLEQKQATTQMEEKQYLDKLWDSYELTYSTAREAGVEIESVAAAQKRIGELRRRMNALGSPNLGAIEEFRRVSERYEFLTGQRDDVETSRKELEQIIGDITAEMTEIFRTEFQKINENFGQTFTEMFGGGTASLQLEDESDVLSCGIDIQVQPPGKQVKNIMLLSGGEKAFVAIALYFAIMKVRPTPFCMLDEIDAALDDTNVTRFASYLRTLSSKTQFIVITHRRGTMEAADVLYGVTMQEQGISRVLTVNLSQVEQELHMKTQ